MRADLNKKLYLDQAEMSGYIYGSADVVGLMCLRVFCDSDDKLFGDLELPAKKLGTAFQKVNFLRDFKSDIENLDRTYFPELVNRQMTSEVKNELVAGMEADFDEALKGIRRLPGRSKLATLVAYNYYRLLLRKIGKISVEKLLSGRIRISNALKLLIMLKSLVVYRLKLI
jgi:phytoene/squalene synthetase